jgi:hypothetical protein
MPMPTTADIAAALVADLNAAVFSRPFTAVRAYLPRYDLGEMENLHVTVVAAGRTVSPASRGAIQVEHRLEIAVQQRLAVEVANACDPLLGLVGELSDHLVGHRLAGAPEAAWVKTEHDPLVDPTHLNELRQFTSLMAVTYRTWEEA